MSKRARSMWNVSAPGAKPSSNLKRLTFDANGNVNGVYNFEPLDGSVDGPYGDIVKLIEEWEAP